MKRNVDHSLKQLLSYTIFTLEKACSNNTCKRYLLVIVRHLVMHNKVAKSIRNKCENYSGQEILPVIIILNLINLIVYSSFN